MKPRILSLLMASSALAVATIPSIADACAKSKSKRVIVVVKTACDAVTDMTSTWSTSTPSTTMQNMLCTATSTLPTGSTSATGPSSGGPITPVMWYPLVLRVRGSGAPFLTFDHATGSSPPPTIACSCGLVIRSTTAGDGSKVEVIGGAVALAGTYEAADSFPAGFQPPEPNATHAWATNLTSQGLLTPGHDVYCFNLAVNGHPTPGQRVEFVYLLRVPKSVPIEDVEGAIANGLALTGAIDNSSFSLMDAQSYVVESVE